MSLESTSSSSTIIACRRLVEAMALVRPGVKWTMWEEKATAGTPINGPKKIISINGVRLASYSSRSSRRSSLICSARLAQNCTVRYMVMRLLRWINLAYNCYISVLIKQRVQNIRVSSGDRRIDGFISLHGSISKVCRDQIGGESMLIMTE